MASVSGQAVVGSRYSVVKVLLIGHNEVTDGNSKHEYRPDIAPLPDSQSSCGICDMRGAGSERGGKIRNKFKISTTKTQSLDGGSVGDAVVEEAKGELEFVEDVFECCLKPGLVVRLEDRLLGLLEPFEQGDGIE